MVKTAESASCELGNTSSSSPKENIRESLRFCFTLNNYNDNLINDLKTAFLKLNCKWVFGREIAPTTGTPHLQGYIRLEKKKSLSSLKKCLGINAIHLEQCKGSEEANIKYCIEDGDYESNFVKVKKPLKLITELKDWQKDIFKLLNEEPDGRTVHWYWDSKGKNW